MFEFKSRFLSGLNIKQFSSIIATIEDRPESTVHAGIGRLPVELLLVIIKHLNREESEAFSLVCWHLRVLCAPVVFESMRIGVSMPVSVLQPLLFSENVLAGIKTLHIRGERQWNVQGKQPPGVNTKKWEEILSIITNTLPSMSALQSIWISNTILSKELVNFIRTSPTLLDLHVMYCRWERSSPLCVYSGRIRNFTVNSVTLDEFSDLMRDACGTLETFLVSTPQHFNFLSKAQTRGLPRLTTLNVPLSLVQGFAGLHPFYQFLATVPTLRELILSMPKQDIFAFPSGILPELQKLECSYDSALQLLPGRPIYSFKLHRIFDSLPSPKFVALLQAISQTSVPITHLSLGLSQDAVKNLQGELAYVIKNCRVLLLTVRDVTDCLETGPILTLMNFTPQLIRFGFDAIESTRIVHESGWVPPMDEQTAATLILDCSKVCKTLQSMTYSYTTHRPACKVGFEAIVLGPDEWRLTTSNNSQGRSSSMDYRSRSGNIEVMW